MYCNAISDMRTTHQLSYTRVAWVTRPRSFTIVGVQGLHVSYHVFVVRRVAAEVSSQSTYGAATLVAKAFVY